MRTAIASRPSASGAVPGARTLSFSVLTHDHGGFHAEDVGVVGSEPIGIVLAGQVAQCVRYGRQRPGFVPTPSNILVRRAFPTRRLRHA
jgi:hypothetical protein